MANDTIITIQRHSEKSIHIIMVFILIYGNKGRIRTEPVFRDKTQ